MAKQESEHVAKLEEIQASHLKQTQELEDLVASLKSEVASTAERLSAAKDKEAESARLITGLEGELELARVAAERAKGEKTALEADFASATEVAERLQEKIKNMKQEHEDR